jgi:hypothetical protein
MKDTSGQIYTPLYNIYIPLWTPNKMVSGSQQDDCCFCTSEFTIKSCVRVDFRNKNDSVICPRKVQVGPGLPWVCLGFAEFVNPWNLVIESMGNLIPFQYKTALFHGPKMSRVACGSLPTRARFLRICLDHPTESSWWTKKREPYLVQPFRLVSDYG